MTDDERDDAAAPKSEGETPSGAGPSGAGPREAADASAGEGDASGATDEERRSEKPTLKLTPLQIAEGRIQELEDKLASTAAEAKANHNKMLRVAADFDNYRKRAAREAEEARARGKTEALNKLLPVFDNLERAVSHVDDSTDAKSMAHGLKMVSKQFIEALGKLGIERIESIGKPFDPMVHESIQYEHHATIPAGLVAQELQPGYKQGDALLRPALVVVSKGPAPEAEAPRAEEPAKADEPAKAKAEEPTFDDPVVAGEEKKAEGAEPQAE